MLSALVCPTLIAAANLEEVLRFAKLVCTSAFAIVIYTCQFEITLNSRSRVYALV